MKHIQTTDISCTWRQNFAQKFVQTIKTLYAEYMYTVTESAATDLRPDNCVLMSVQHAKYDKTWWSHQMEAFSALLALYAGNSPVTDRFPTQSPVTRSIDVSLIFAWTNGWANNPDAGDLRSHRAHYVTVMNCICCRTDRQLNSLLKSLSIKTD